MYFDLIIAAILIISIGLGIKKGFLLEFFSLFGVIVSIFLTKKMVTFLTLQNILKIESSKSSYLITYLIIFIAIYIMFFLFIISIKKFIKNLFIGWIDRGLGGVIGAIKGLLVIFVIMIITVGLSYLNKDIKNGFESSFSGKIFVKLSPDVSKFFPEKIGVVLDKYKKEKSIEEIIIKSVKDREKKEIQERKEVQEVLKKEVNEKELKIMLDEMKKEKANGKD